MEFKIKTSALKKALVGVSGSLEKKVVNQAISNVMIESIGENEVRITATDYDITLRHDADAEIIKPGALCIEGRRLLALAQSLPECDVHFTRQPNLWASVETPRTKIKLAGIDPATFPAVPCNKSTPIRIKGDDLRTLIQRTLFAGTADVSQHLLNSVKLEINGDAKMAATDKYRLAFSKCAAGGDLDIIIPRKTAMEIAKLEGNEIFIGDDDNHIFAETEGVLLISRKMTGTFPDYNFFFPKEVEMSASFDIEEMREAIKRCGLLASLDTVRCGLSPDGAVLTSHTANAGDIEETIEIEYNGAPITLGFRWPHFLDFLNLAGTGRASIGFSADPFVPALLTADSLPDYKYILVLLNLVAQDNAKAAVEAAK